MMNEEAGGAHKLRDLKLVASADEHFLDRNMLLRRNCHEDSKTFHVPFPSSELKLVNYKTIKILPFSFAPVPFCLKF